MHIVSQSIAPDSVVNSQVCDVYENQLIVKLSPNESIDVRHQAFLAGKCVSLRPKMTDLADGSHTYIPTTFSSTLTAGKNSEGWIVIATSKPAQIAAFILLPNVRLVLAATAYLASSTNVHIQKGGDNIIRSQAHKLHAVTCDDKSGHVFLQADMGSIAILEATPDQPITYDCKHIIAYTEVINVRLRNTVNKASNSSSQIFEFNGKSLIFISSHIVAKMYR